MSTSDRVSRREPLTRWSSLVRTVLAVDHGGSRYEAEVDFLSLRDENVRLYRDSTLVAERASPARFELPDGARIEVASTLYGVRKARLLSTEGEFRMGPLPETLEYRRIRWNHAHPTAAAVIGVLAVVVLLLVAVVSVPQLLELLANTGIAESAGFAFESPFVLPAEVNAALPVAAAVAALERATRLAHNRWLDDVLPELID